MKALLIAVLFTVVLISPGAAQEGAPQSVAMPSTVVPLVPGWNNIGSMCTGPIGAVISVDPPGNVVSPYYGYNAGYFAATDVVTGSGYWVKAAEAGSLSFSCGTPDPCGTLQVGYGGKIYSTVEIGSQCWMTENLNFGLRVDGSNGQANNGTIEKYCYDDNPANCDTYGGLYTWDEAMQYVTTPGVQGICPAGWHIPTSAELSTLVVSGGGGMGLLAVGQGWGSNSSGFTGLLAGRYAGSYAWSGVITWYWSSSETDLSNASTLSLEDFDGPFNPPVTKATGNSIRCLKD